MTRIARTSTGSFVSADSGSKPAGGDGGIAAALFAASDAGGRDGRRAPVVGSLAPNVGSLRNDGRGGSLRSAGRGGSLRNDGRGGAERPTGNGGAAGSL